jgi:phenylalanyl-tRNA synthetase alpha chain
MLARLEELRAEAEASLASAQDIEALQKIKSTWLGKNGKLTELLRAIPSLSPEEKRIVGSGANQIKQFLTEGLADREEDLLNAQTDAPAIDLTLPGYDFLRGGLHPTRQMRDDLNAAFATIGFEVYEGREITTEKDAFDNMNFEDDHPARETMDTYWLAGTENEKAEKRLCLRPHLTGASVHYLREHGAPARFVYPGMVYRNESTDPGHERAFYQYEALIVEKDFSFSSGHLLIKTILEKVFGHPVETRMRAGFFPFVEPGFEIDMRCQVCGGEGCGVCKQVGWIEIMPGGVPHPNVLRAAGLDPEEWSGFYINIGLDRLVMMRYGIDDVRLFHSADLRFLEQFK